MRDSIVARVNYTNTFLIHFRDTHSTRSPALFSGGGEGWKGAAYPGSEQGQMAKEVEEERTNNYSEGAQVSGWESWRREGQGELLIYWATTGG
jgi:hypothetical protein